MKRGSNERRQVFAVGFAALAHLLVLFGLGWRVPRVVSPPRPDEPDSTLEVTLVRPQQRAVRRPSAAWIQPSQDYRPRSAAPSDQSAPSSIPLPSTSGPTPDVSANADTAGERLRNTLQSLTHCGSASVDRLTQEERLGCEHRLAQAAPAPVHPDFSPGELAAFDADKAQERQGSILTRTLHDNCLPRLGDRPSPSATMGRSMARGLTTTYGVGCSFRF